MKQTDQDPIYEYQVQAQEKLPSNVWRFVITPIDNTFSYRAGQYIKIRYPNGLFLPFSIANAPNPEGTLELHIRSYDDDVATHDFIEEISSKRKIWFSGPYGNSYYRKEIKAPILLLAAGTGFAPCKAILEAIFQATFTKQVHLYWGVRHVEDFYLLDLPLRWEQQQPNFLFTPVVSQASEQVWQGRYGYITNWVVNDYPNLADFQIYLFGSMQMATAAKQLFLAQGLRGDCLFSDML